jgi:hypothetical protein
VIIYVRLESEGCEIHCTLLLSRARVLPLKKITISRGISVHALRWPPRWIQDPKFLWQNKSDWPNLFDEMHISLHVVGVQRDFRVAEIKTRTNVLLRPTQKLCVLLEAD